MLLPLKVEEFLYLGVWQLNPRSCLLCCFKLYLLFMSLSTSLVHISCVCIMVSTYVEKGWLECYSEPSVSNTSIQKQTGILGGDGHAGALYDLNGPSRKPCTCIT